MSPMAAAPDHPAQDADRFFGRYLGPFTDVAGAPLVLAGTDDEDGAEPEPHIWRSID
ncbi:hypothetical protein [Streptomyces sp. HNM0574]|uniref:hypothetical protein n=1 Tax=Streptomyces sp. HNM0574 TaxID=2714954 RepID=UPI00146EB7B6|nr:hypothetical protein [Streptomyces sp. HNM0574]NLU67565.1 hypothetical protein [Streptomyces sp. HNM0574]